MSAINIERTMAAVLKLQQQAIDHGVNMMQERTRSTPGATLAAKHTERESGERVVAAAQAVAAAVRQDCAYAADQRAEPLAEALRTLVDDEPCRFDHNGDCQAHNVDQPCSMVVARDALAAHDRQAAP